MKTLLSLCFAITLLPNAHAEKKFKDDFGREFVVLEPTDILRMLDTALAGVTEFELISLDPGQPAGSDGTLFHAAIIGRATTKKKDEVATLRKALIQAIREAPKEAYECFMPRHALRACRGSKEIEIVLCFECQQATMSIGKDEIPFFPISAVVERNFDQIFASHGLRKAEKKTPNKTPEPTP